MICFVDWNHVFPAFRAMKLDTGSRRFWERRCVNELIELNIKTVTFRKQQSTFSFQTVPQSAYSYAREVTKANVPPSSQSVLLIDAKTAGNIIKLQKLSTWSTRGDLYLRFGPFNLRNR